MAKLNALQIDTGPEPQHTIIWLHGLGANGHDFEPVVPEFAFSRETPVRFIFPHAPELPVTINGGMVMPAWYDILAMDVDRKVDAEQLRASAGMVAELIKAERERGVASENIILGGFSQGGAVAYELALSYPERLGGLFALSTYFATADSIELSDANRNLPIFIGHGRFDQIVMERLGQTAHQTLQNLGFEPEYQSYGMEHSLCLEEVKDLDRFLKPLVAPKPAHE
ncbi:carboxylesterase 2 [Marinobacter sp. JH2]|uniref:alpha/beta hydrolase n=1 Tax=Marinobacter sp. AL4B TaxID=2871173 RepID=UPI0010561B6B|nr:MULTISPECIES: dienelactone hydrolase family protein [unclassified Marinobacter]MBZ0334793.1 dienelactone hydrolase family protein [Marinobacter sp. AL4B]QBM19221.1 carboxylesterase 2 [Marinobacter sp. JH2]